MRSTIDNLQSCAFNFPGHQRTAHWRDIKDRLDHTPAAARIGTQTHHSTGITRTDYIALQRETRSSNFSTGIHRHTPIEETGDPIWRPDQTPGFQIAPITAVFIFLSQPIAGPMSPSGGVISPLPNGKLIIFGKHRALRRAHHPCSGVSNRHCAEPDSNRAAP